MDSSDSTTNAYMQNCSCELLLNKMRKPIVSFLKKPMCFNKIVVFFNLSTFLATPASKQSKTKMKADYPFKQPWQNLFFVLKNLLSLCSRVIWLWFYLLDMLGSFSGSFSLRWHKNGESESKLLLLLLKRAVAVVPGWPELVLQQGSTHCTHSVQHRVEPGW